jgi:hypothetical protein
MHTWTIDPAQTDSLNAQEVMSIELQVGVEHSWGRHAPQVQTGRVTGVLQHLGLQSLMREEVCV